MPGFYLRLSSTQRKSLPEPRTKSTAGPPSRLVPVLGTRNGKGCIGFLSVDAGRVSGAPNNQGELNETRQNAYTAAEFVFDLFRSLDHELGRPELELLLSEGGGTSLSLAAMIAALGRILGINWPPDMVSTGCLATEEGKTKLVPVEPSQLSAKIDAAIRFGYRRLILVKGQLGIPDSCDLEILFVDPEPTVALFDLLRLVSNLAAKEQQIAGLLAVYDQRNPRLSPEKAKALTEPFLQHHSRLVRHVVYDIRSRAALHHGETEESNFFREKAEKLRWYDYPTGWLGHYLRYEQTASRAILAVDMGHWNDGDSVNSELDQRLEHLKSAIFGGFADTNDCFAALALSNTRAMRNRFLARLEQKTDRLESAWNDLMLFYNDWDRLFLYCEKIGRKDSNYSRQKNYCIEALVDYWTMEKNVPDWPNVENFLKMLLFDESNLKDAFDLVAWLDWKMLSNQPPSENELDFFLVQAGTFFENRKEHPNFLPFEKVLRYNLGNESQLRISREKLALSPHLNESETSILYLLALRTRRILGFSLPTPDSTTPIAQIARELLQAPDTLVVRCPY